MAEMAGKALRHLCGGALVATLAGCGGSNAQPSGLSELRAQLDGARVCALLIAPEWPIGASADTLSRPGVDALIAAGVIRREPINNRAKVTPRARIVMTPAGERDLRLFRLSGDSPPTPQLCFGKKQVTAIEQGAGSTRYRYRIIDAPVWALRADVRAAFPFVPRMLDREQQAELGVVEKSGRLKIPGGVEQAGVTEIGNKGVSAVSVYGCRTGGRFVSLRSRRSLVVSIFRRRTQVLQRLLPRG